MGLKSVLKKIGLVGAGIAATVPSPISGIAGAAVEALKGAGIIKDPAAEQRAREALLAFETEMAEKELRYVSAINETIRAELQSGSSFQRSWRPLVGYTLAFVILNNFVFIPYAAAFGVPIQVISIPGEVWNVMLAVVGVAAFTRGAEKIVGVYRNGNGNGKH